MRLVKALLIPAAVCAVGPAFAIDIEYAQDRNEALVECDQLLYSGRFNEAQDCFLILSDDHPDAGVRADASRRIGDSYGANNLFREAVAENPEDPALRARWGELFRSTFQFDVAADLYRESLEIDAEYVPAVLGLAELAARQFQSEADRWIDAVLELDPQNVQAHLIRARISLQESELETAEESLDTALESAEARGQTPLEVYALLASLDLLKGNTESEWTQRALDLNPRYGEIYAEPANIYVITRRYREAVELFRKAVEIQPDLYSAHIELGVNLLRDNHVEEAYEHLRKAQEGIGGFSAKLNNTLTLVDSFENFVVSEHGSLADPASDDPPVLLRLHRDETQVLAPYAVDVINDTIATFSQRYDFDLVEPVIAELYPDHDDFSVRTLGLPEIGLLGVTFGYLVAMDSPTGRPEGEFHWGTTLWHEMAHVFTLEATNHLVPRWFSEGVSVFEEWSTGPLAGRHIALPFFQAMKEDLLLPVAELDDGFMRPEYAAQVIVSYMQAGLVCEFIANNFGQDKLASMLVSYRDGLDTPEALEAATGLTPEAFDEQFFAHIDTLYGSIVESYEDWNEHQEEAHQHLANEAWRDAIAAAESAIAIFPQFVDEGSALLVKARAHIALEEDALALDTLIEYHSLGGYHPDALRQLANRLKEAGRDAEALAVLDDLPLVAPFREDLHADLGDWLLEAGRSDEALREYEALMSMNPHDKAAAHLRLARVYQALENASLSREHLLYALEIAPHFREAQDMLLETLN